jgi:hypothetical protein
VHTLERAAPAPISAANLLSLRGEEAVRPERQNNFAAPRLRNEPISVANLLLQRAEEDVGPEGYEWVIDHDKDGEIFKAGWEIYD